jgi:tetratricopeptide (TPR) repeat protein
MSKFQDKPTIHVAVGKRQMLLAVATLLVLAFAAYSNTFNCPFTFDDIGSIEENTSIREWRTALTPDLKIGETASGRPVLNLTLAINYKISGLDVWSYHAGNLLIHFLAGLALFGVVRRTLLLPVLRERFGQNAFMLGWLVAAIWLAHPLATESVTYIIQRAESLMALFYLMTLYCFIRGGTGFQPVSSKTTGKLPMPQKPHGQDAHATLWLILTVFFCLLGMATKEVMVSAPVMLFLYDAAFISGSLRKAWRRRKRWHIAFALTWIPLVLLMINTGSRGDTVGFSADPEVTWWPYALTQCWAFVHYLRLAILPWPLVFDYGLFVYTDAAQVWWQMLFVAAFAGACFILYWKRPRASWLGLFYLAVLAPTTSVIPVATQVIAEHRMYLPLTAIVTLAVLLGYHFISRRVLWAGLAVVALFAVMTFERNKVYADGDIFWMDVVRKYPLNARANGNVGNRLVQAGRIHEALPYLEKAIALHPSRGDHYNNLGYAYARMKDFEKAVFYYELADGKRIFTLDVFYKNYADALMELNRIADAEQLGLRLLKKDTKSLVGLVIMGNVSRAQNNLTAAETYFRHALEINDENPEVWNNWGNVKALQGGKLEEALDYYKKAAALAPSDADILDNAARLLSQLGRWQEAVPYFEAELTVAPDDITVRGGYADALYASQRFADAAEQYKICLRKDPSRQRHVGGQTVALMAKEDAESARPLAQAMVDAVPDNPSNRVLLANILVALNRGEESLPHYQVAARAEPARVEIRYNHAVALTQCGRYAEAVTQYEEALKLMPYQPLIRHGYAVALEKLGRVQEAIAQEQEALRLQPGLQEAKENLDRLTK